MGKRKDDQAPFWIMMNQAEANIIGWALEQVGSIQRAAGLLGVNEGYLYNRCRALGLGKAINNNHSPKKPKPGAGIPEAESTEVNSTSGVEDEGDAA